MTNATKGLCGFKDCEKREHAKGLCRTHYARLLRHGDASVVNKPGVPAGLRPKGLCSVDGCARDVYVKGFCMAHYSRWKAHGDPLAGKAKEGVVAHRKIGDKCSVPGCDREARVFGMCHAHDQRVKATGDPQANVPIRKLLPGQREYRDGGGYVGRWDSVRKRVVWDHRVAMEKFLGRELRGNESVHHINGDRADNRIENLELWVSSQPAGQRPLDLLNWAEEIIKLYGKEKSKLRRLKYRAETATLI